MTNRWYVCNKDRGGEISVNFGNPKEHFDSYGWTGLHKILVGEDVMEEIPSLSEIYDPKSLNKAEKLAFRKEIEEMKERNKKLEIKILEIANCMANALNEAKITID